MYTPPYNAMDEAELRPMVEAVGSAELITLGDDGFPVATRLPVLCPLKPRQRTVPVHCVGWEGPVGQLFAYGQPQPGLERLQRQRLQQRLPTHRNGGRR